MMSPISRLAMQFDLFESDSCSKTWELSCLPLLPPIRASDRSSSSSAPTCSTCQRWTSSSVSCRWGYPAKSNFIPSYDRPTSMGCVKSLDEVRSYYHATLALFYIELCKKVKCGYMTQLITFIKGSEIGSQQSTFASRIMSARWIAYHKI